MYDARVAVTTADASCSLLLIKILINVIHCSCTIVPSRCRLVSSLSIKSLVGMSGLRADARPDIPTNN